jgi:hypothetical protein
MALVPAYLMALRSFETDGLSADFRHIKSLYFIYL